MSDQDDYPKNTKNDNTESEYATTLSGEVRLQKLLAHRGITSRRNAEELIAGGLVTVNGRVETTPGTKVDPQRDVVVVEGRMLPREKETFLFLFYKPKGVISAVFDPDGKPT
ncbi:ribosomal large subunit pseudouridine synthase B, partial [mine drainage metagenome]